MNYPFQLQPEQPPSSHRALESDDYELVVRQQPRECLVTLPGKEKNRKPVDPPPIVELKVTSNADPARQFLQSPYLFMQCTLQIDQPSSENPTPQVPVGQEITGQSVSSLHRLKDINNEDGGFFVFGDISIKVAGKHRLNFSLFELRKDNGEVVFLKSIFSDPFDVVLGKHWRGLVESTHLSRTFSDQGVRLRLRKENRNMAGSKRTFPYSPRAGAQAGPQAGPSNFGYEDESNKRQRSNEQVQPQGYSMQERAAIAYDPRAASQSMQSAYTLQQQQQQQQQQASLQSPPTSFGSRTPIANTGWQHAPQVFSTLQGSMSAPARYPESGADSAQGITPSPGAANYALQPASSLTVDPGPPFARRGTDAYMPMTHQHQHQHPQTSPTTPYQTSGEAMYLPTNANMPSASSYSDHEPRQHTQTHSVASPASSTRSGLNPTTTNYPMQQQQQQQLPPQQYATLPDTSHYVYPSYQHRPYQAAPTSLLQQPLSNISDPLGIRSQHQQHALGNPLELHQQQQQQQQPSSPYIHQQQQLPNLSIRQQQPGEPYAQHSQQQQYAADLGQGYSQSGGRAYPTTQPPDQSREF